MNFKPKFVKKGDSKTSNETNRSYDPITKYMATDLVTFTPDTEIIEVIDAMLEHKFSGAPVLNENKELVGIISEQDCLTVIVDSVYHNLPISKSIVSKYMTTDLQTIKLDADILDVANKFLNSHFKRFPVVDDKGRLVGQVSRRDILRAVKAMNITTWQKELAN